MAHTEGYMHGRENPGVKGLVIEIPHRGFQNVPWNKSFFVASLRRVKESGTGIQENNRDPEGCHKNSSIPTSQISMKAPI
jgi:hypothetical protein